jgi:hypothetical protein
MSDRAKFALAFAVLGALLLTFGGARHLFMPAPPMLDRAGRAVALVLVPGLYSAAAFLVAFAAYEVAPKQWPVAARSAVIAAATVSAASACTFATTIGFVALHFVCYTARLCEVSAVPATALRAVAVATVEPLWLSFAVLPAVAVAVAWARRRDQRGSTAP